MKCLYRDSQREKLNETPSSSASSRRRGNNRTVQKANYVKYHATHTKDLDYAGSVKDHPLLFAFECSKPFQSCLNRSRNPSMSAFFKSVGGRANYIE